MIGKHIKPYGFQLILVVILIALQAITSLMLPEHMSNIVDVGITQNGIEYSAPEAIEKKSMEAVFNDGDKIYEYYHIASESELKKLENFSDVNGKEVYIINSAESLELAAPFFEKGFENKDNKASSLAVDYIITEYKGLGYNFSNSQNSYILKYGGLMVIIALISTVCAIAAGFVNSRATSGFSRDLRKSLFTKVLSFSNEEMENFSTASLITRSTNDIQQIQQFLSMGMRMLIFAPVMGIGAILKILGTEPYMSRIMAVSVAVTFMVIIFSFININPRFKLMQKLTDKINLVVREHLSGILVIKAFANEEASEERFDEANKEVTDNMRFIGKLMGTMFPALILIMNLTSIAIVYFGAGLLEIGSIQVGDIMAFIQYASNVLMSFIFISMFSIMLPRTLVSMGRVREVLESETIIKNKEKTMKLPSGSKGEVLFESVSFKYPDADEYVLEKVSFIAKPGETTAFIGTTGSGKSTVINLIPRLYDTTEGEIKIDGINVRDLELEDLRNKITFAPQKGLLFSGTIESNIKFAGNVDISDEDMKRAADIAQAEEFISEKEDGFESHIAQGGSNVSGGQRQRLSIARAIAKPADILIFDDSFSALDYKTDAKLRQAINRELKGKTIILVAQRIATIRHANKIIVLDEGKIIAEGVHDELIKDCEIYKQLAVSQIS